MKRFLVAFGMVSLLALAGAAPASACFRVVVGSPGFVAAPWGGFVGAPVVAPAPVFFPQPVPFGYGYAPYGGYAPPYGYGPYGYAAYYPHYRFGWHDTWYEGPYFGGRSEQIYGFTLPGGR